jgi:hypothetical protein
MARQVRFWVRRHAGFVGWLIVVAGVVVALAWTAHLHDQAQLRNELRTHQLCENQNDTRQVLRGVLEALAEPRDDDEPGEQEERQRLLERVLPIIEPIECPPLPERLREVAA